MEEAVSRTSEPPLQPRRPAPASWTRSPTTMRVASAEGASAGRATKRSCRRSTESMPTRPISSVSPTPAAPGVSHFCTSRSTARAEQPDRAQVLRIEQLAHVVGRLGPTKADTIGAR